MSGYDRHANGGWAERRRAQSPNGNGIGEEKGWWQDSKQAHWGDEKGWREVPRSSAANDALSLVPAPATLRFILLCCLWYTSSALSSNTGKSIMLIFKFPVTLTFVQFGFIAGYCLLLASPLVGLTRIRRPSAAVLHSTIPMAVFQVGGHIFSSFAISRIPVSTVHTIKALSPLFTVAAYALLFGVKYSPKTYISLLPLTIGVMLACTFDVSASNVFGLVSAFGSALIFVSSNIFFKKIMPTPNSGGAGPAHKLDKINLLFYSSGIAFLMMIPIWLYYDLTALLNRWSAGSIIAVNKHANPGGHSLAYYFFANGTVHFAQNIIAFAILATTSPVTYSIASLIKRIAVICIAIVWFNQKIHPAQGLGICLTFFGLWMYNQAKGDVERGEKQARRVEATREMMLPSTKAEARMLTGTATPDMIEERQPLYPLRPTHVNHHSRTHLPPLNIELAHSAFASKHNTIISAGMDQPYPYPSPPRSIDSPPPESSDFIHPVGHSNAADTVEHRTLSIRRTTVSNNLEGVPLSGPK